MFATSASVIPYVKAGRLRALAVTTAQRSPSAARAADGVGGRACRASRPITWHGVRGAGGDAGAAGAGVSTGARMRC